MKKIIILTFLITMCSACEKNSDKGIIEDSVFICRIVGFDLNCSICILEFPDDSLEIKKDIGKSANNYYQAINLNKGDFLIGQFLKVKIRKPATNELTPCITLYPSFDYESVYVTESENFEELSLNDTLEVLNKDCKYHSVYKFYLCLDSILEDSRCPIGATCIWEGNARVRFRFEKLNENPIYFVLNTHLGSVREAFIDEYKISLIDLLPYPSLENQPVYKDYYKRRKAVVLINKIN